MNCLACGELTTDYVSKIPTQYCKKCGLLFQTISRSKKDMEKLYRENFWREHNVEETLDSDFTNKKGKDLILLWNSMYKYSKDFLQNKIEFLEIGAGTGNSLFMFENAGYNVIGIEPDPNNTRLINQKLNRGKCITGFVEQITTEKKFDIIWMSHSLEHVFRPDEILLKCFELLKKDGIVFIAIPDCENPEMRNQSINNDSHLWHFTRNALKNLALRTGYKVEKCDSLKLIKTNERRIHKILRKMNLSRLSEIILPYYPFKLTTKKNGYEIRIILRKK